ncbi:MAG: hypothetical protein ACRDCC_06245 [Culicoidibacterales bacterium]
MSYLKINNFNTEDNDIVVLSLGEFEDVIMFERLKTASNERLSFDRYSNRQRQVSLLFENADGFRTFKRALMSEFIQTFVFGDDEDLSFLGHVISLQRKQLNEELFEYTVTIELYAFGYLKNRKEILATNGTVNNKGDIHCEPLITVFGNGTACKLTIGDYVLELDIDKNLTIECKKTEANVYDKDGNLANSRMKGDFPVLDVGLNGVVLGTGINSVEFEMRERVL